MVLYVKVISRNKAGNVQTVRLEKWMVLRNPDDTTVGAANKYIGIGNSVNDTPALQMARG